MLKVIELIPTLVMGGAETMIKDYCLLFDKDKIDVHVVVIDHRYGTSNEELLDKNGIKVTYLSELLYGNRQNINSVQRAIRKISRYYYWRKIVMEERPDVIHMHLHLDRYMKVIPLKRLKCKLVMTIHNVIENFFSKNKSDGDKYKEYKEVCRLVHNYSMKLITLHDELRDKLKVFFDTADVVTINNGVVLDRFNPKLYDRKIIRSTLEIQEDEFLIGNVASFSFQKNHDLILDVFEEISKIKKNAKLLLIGNGDRKGYIQDRIKNSGLDDRVILLSNRGDIPELMSAMDVFFFPSRWEGFGNVMIEAQSMGLKCVVSEAVPECTRVSNKVIVCNLCDDKKIWIKALLDNDYKTENIVCNILEYDMVACVRHLENLYNQMIEINRKG